MIVKKHVAALEIHHPITPGSFPSASCNCQSCPLTASCIKKAVDSCPVASIQLSISCV
ncbi:hypothetical protein Hanom_Chr08g00721781 [Helianthus anomalus]